MTTMAITTRKEAKEAIDTFVASHIEGANPSVTEPIITALTDHRDPQVRDYLMGLGGEYELSDLIPALEAIGEALPNGNKRAIYAVLIALNYECGDMGLAKANLILALNEDSDYSLAKLLNRVMVAGWPSEAFTEMRRTIHPQVVEGLDDTEVGGE